MNPKVKKALFTLTFLPYAAVLFICLYGAVFGIEFFFITSYGLDGFLLGLLLSALLIVVYVPVIPVCAVFHILCLLRKIVPFIRKISTKKFAVICLILCTIAAAVPLIHTYL